MRVDVYSKRGNVVGTMEWYGVSKPGQHYSVWKNFEKKGR